MITEDYVSFETAKLLKENGFENDAISCINVFKGHIYKIQDRVIDANDDITIPTLQMAMKWLRKTHNLFIGINTVIGSDKNWGYEVFIQKQEIPIPSKMQWDWFNSYEEACEAAIKYCLENLL